MTDFEKAKYFIKFIVMIGLPIFCICFLNKYKKLMKDKEFYESYGSMYDKLNTKIP
jgi:hypothetical protein